MSDDITYRLNINSVSRVYSVSLPAILLYAIFLKKSIILKNIYKIINHCNGFSACHFAEFHKIHSLVFVEVIGNCP